MENLDFIPRQPGSGNPFEGQPTQVFWKCEHGDVKGPDDSSELKWDGGHCEVVGYRKAVENDPAIEEAGIYGSCNVIIHLAHINPELSKEAVYRIIKGENHKAVTEDVFSKLSLEDAVSALMGELLR